MRALIWREVENHKLHKHTKSQTGETSSQLQTTALPLLLNHLSVSALRTFLVEVLNLSKTPPLLQEPLDGWWILANTVPATRRIANQVLRVSHPILTLL